MELCKNCKHFQYCQKEFWVSEHTEQQSVLGCMKGEENIPLVDEDMQEVSNG